MILDALESVPSKVLDKTGGAFRAEDEIVGRAKLKLDNDSSPLATLAREETRFLRRKEHGYWYDSVRSDVYERVYVAPKAALGALPRRPPEVPRADRALVAMHYGEGGAAE